MKKVHQKTAKRTAKARTPAPPAKKAQSPALPPAPVAPSNAREAGERLGVAFGVENARCLYAATRLAQGRTKNVLMELSRIIFEVMTSSRTDETLRERLGDGVLEVTKTIYLLSTDLELISATLGLDHIPIAGMEKQVAS